MFHKLYTYYALNTSIEDKLFGTFGLYLVVIKYVMIYIKRCGLSNNNNGLLFISMVVLSTRNDSLTHVLNCSVNSMMLYINIEFSF